MTSQEKQHIKGLLQDPRWKTIENLANDICNKIALEELIERETEWDSLRYLLLGRGQIQGIKRLLQELWNQMQ